MGVRLGTSGPHFRVADGVSGGTHRDCNPGGFLLSSRVTEFARQAAKARRESRISSGYGVHGANGAVVAMSLLRLDDFDSGETGHGALLRDVERMGVPDPLSSLVWLSPLRSDGVWDLSGPGEAQVGAGCSGGKLGAAWQRAPTAAQRHAQVDEHQGDAETPYVRP